jgi:hypothetical protein
VELERKDDSADVRERSRSALLGKRGYKTLRIPETIALRVHRQLRIAS